MRKKDRDLEKEERREREEIIGRRPVKPDKNQIKKNREKAEKKIKRVKRSTTFFYWVILGAVIGILIGAPSVLNVELLVSLAVLGLVILAWKNAYHRGFFRTLLLPVGYGLGVIVMILISMFIRFDYSFLDFIKIVEYSLIKNPTPCIVIWSFGAAPALVGVILGSLFGIGYRRKIRG